MPFFADQLNRPVHLPQPPQRIFSLVPSQTELLYDLGLEKEVVGITKFCVHPQTWFREKTRVGGTKNVNITRLLSLQPDLVLASKEENVAEQINEIAAHCPVWVSDIRTLNDALQMIGSVGEITGRETAASRLMEEVEAGFATLPAATPALPAVYLIWNDPIMTVGGDTFIHDLLQRAGFQNLFAAGNRYPQLSPEQLKNSGCRVLLLSSEPYPFQEKHRHYFQDLLPGAAIAFVDGELFSWYGSRLRFSPSYFRNLQRQIRSLL